MIHFSVALLGQKLRGFETSGTDCTVDVDFFVMDSLGTLRNDDLTAVSLTGFSLSKLVALFFVFVKLLSFISP